MNGQQPTHTGARRAVWNLDLFMTGRVSAPVGEALGAIGDPVVLDLLRDYSQDPVIEVPTERAREK